MITRKDEWLVACVALATAVLVKASGGYHWVQLPIVVLFGMAFGAVVWLATFGVDHYIVNRIRKGNFKRVYNTVPHGKEWAWTAIKNGREIASNKELSILLNELLYTKADSIVVRTTTWN